MPVTSVPKDWFSGGSNIAPDPDTARQLAELLNEIITLTNSNESAIGALDTDAVANASGVAGATCSAALDQLATDIGALDSDAIANASGVAGASVSAALNQLATDIGALGSDDIADDSGMGLASVTACLDALDGRAGSFVSDENLAVAATVTERRFVATADGVIDRFGAQAATGAAAGESTTCDVQINGVSALTAAVVLDDAAGVGYVAGAVDVAANTFTAGDVITVVKTYVAGGAPTPMADICAPVQARLT